MQKVGRISSTCGPNRGAHGWLQLVQGPHVDSVVQDQRLLLGQGPIEGPSVEGAREMFAYLCQYLTSLRAEVRRQPSCLPTQLLLLLAPFLGLVSHQTHVHAQDVGIVEVYSIYI